jgi:hypothetical protein
MRFNKTSLEKFTEQVNDWNASLTDVKTPLSETAFTEADELLTETETAFGTMQMKGKLNQQGMATLCAKISAPNSWINSEKCPDDLKHYAVNRLLQDFDDDYLIRYREDVCRAVLSNRYMVYNHKDLWDAILDGVNRSNLSTLKPTVWKPVLEDRMSLWLLFEGVIADPDKPIRSYDGGGAGGLKPAIHIRNGEDGSSRIGIKSGLHRGYCDNGVIFGFNKKSQYEAVHLGRNKSLTTANIHIALAETAQMAGLGIQKYVEATDENIITSINDIVGIWAKRYKISTDQTNEWAGFAKRAKTWADLVMATSDYAGTIEDREAQEQLEEISGEMLFANHRQYVA